MLLPLLLNLGFAGRSGGVSAAPEAPELPPKAKGHGRSAARGRPFLRYVVELADETFYFANEWEAREFLERRAKSLKRQAKAIARKTHRITLPVGATPIALPEIRPLPRFVVTGSDAVAQLSQRINAQLDAIMANPESDADIDDDDLMRLLQ